MAGTSRPGIRSTAAIKGHPLHPFLVPLPIGLLVATLGADLGFWYTADPFWARAALWLVGAGLVSGAVAALFGLVDFLTIRQIREHGTAWAHFAGNGVALVLAAWSLLHRLGDPAAAALPGGLTLSALIVAILLVTGWLGGELTYRHRIGVIEDKEIRRMPARATEPRGAGFTPDYGHAGSKPAIASDRKDG